MDHELQQVIEAQRRAAAAAERQYSADRISSVLGARAESLAPRRGSNEDIQRLAEQLRERVADRALDPNVCRKVARALVEGRISEHQVFGVASCLDHARSRGAYFVVAMKKVFIANDLPWFEEEWK